MEVEIDYTSLFQAVRNKRILIYGTGVISKRVIRALSDFHIIGVIDKIHFGGNVEGIPVKMWDDVFEGDADVVIIASLPQNYYDIYQRIVDRCVAYDMKIYDTSGRNLLSYYGVNYISRFNALFFKKNEDELLQKISRYEAVSFDLFDTLIMRKNLESSDLFDIVDMKIKERGIFVPNYKKLRREADIQAKGGNIYKIYNILQQMTKISDKEKGIILDEEIKCEKECIVPRKKMVEIMKRTHEQGKTVSIITNIYLTENILREILQEKGITGYDYLYVSCEYGLTKENGLFKKYLQDMKAKNYLHIGNDKIEDSDIAIKHNINVYSIKSAYEMLKLTNMRKILADVHNSSEKGLIGLIISELFNNPFALYDTSGVVKITDIKLFGKIFVAPIVIIYMLKLLNLINDKKNCDGVLFSSRDGYFFKKLYDNFQPEMCSKRFQKVPSWYFFASRKLCLRASMITENDIKNLVKYIRGNDVENVLTQILGIPSQFSYVEKEYNEVVDYYLAHKEMIMEKSKKTRNNYYKYMEKNGIERNEEYILCDLVSHGTVQYMLNRILEKATYGFYLCKVSGENSYNVTEYSCYRVCEKNMGNDTVSLNSIFLESVLTSLEPSVEDMDSEGNPVFGLECRKNRELEDIEFMQNGIEEFFFDYMYTMYIDGEEITMKLPELLLEMHNLVWLEDRCKDMSVRKYYDDFYEEYAYTFRDI